MMNIHSKWLHRLLAAIAVLGTTGAVYADHCRNKVYSSDCGTQQTQGVLDCSWSDEFQSYICPEEPLYVVTPGRVHTCVYNADVGGTTCDPCGEQVSAKRQKYKCAEPGESCAITEDGLPEDFGDPCCSATIDGTCGH